MAISIMSIPTKLVVKNNADKIIVKGSDFSVTFSKKADGGLSSYIYKGQEQIRQTLLPHFTRPLTDNDKRGWKPQRKLKQWYNNDIQLVSTTGRDQPLPHYSGRSILCEYKLIHDSARVFVRYFIKDNGIIHVYYSLSVKPGLPNIPKVGMQMGIERSYDNIEWFGKGPMENYIDKNYGVDVGVYELPINKFMENYVVPQENGNRTDVRWIRLSDKQKDGLMIVADSLLSMSAWPYTEENILNAKHTNKLKDAGFITLNIDLVQMGVGGNDSWSDVAAPLEKYQIKAKDYSYSFSIVPFNAKNNSAGERAKENKF